MSIHGAVSRRGEGKSQLRLSGSLAFRLSSFLPLERRQPATVSATRLGRHTMLMSTTTAIDGRPVSRYLGVVTGEAIIGANIFRDLFAKVRDVVGGRSATYEKAL